MKTEFLLNIKKIHNSPDSQKRSEWIEWVECVHIALDGNMEGIEKILEALRELGKLE